MHWAIYEPDIERCQNERNAVQGSSVATEGYRDVPEPFQSK